MAGHSVASSARQTPTRLTVAQRQERAKATEHTQNAVTSMIIMTDCGLATNNQPAHFLTSMRGLANNSPVQLLASAPGLKSRSALERPKLQLKRRTDRRQDPTVPREGLQLTILPLTTTVRTKIPNLCQLLYVEAAAALAKEEATLAVKWVPQGPRPIFSKTSQLPRSS